MTGSVCAARIIEHRFCNLTELAQAFAAACAQRLNAAIDARGCATIALSGGRTPGHLYPVLARMAVDWPHVTCTLTDERWVPTDHVESNERMVRHCFHSAPAEAAAFIGLRFEEATLEDGARAAERALNEVPWPLDIVHLGIGVDGHIASLFPGDGDVSPKGNTVAVAATSVHGPRISLSMAALATGRTIFIVYAGSEKAAVFQSARAGRLPHTHPVARLLSAVPELEVFSAP